MEARKSEDVFCVKEPLPVKIVREETEGPYTWILYLAAN